MTDPRLHLDMDASRRDVYLALLKAGQDITHTPNPEVNQDASDEYQLLWATSHQRILFSFNVKDFIHLARLHPHHSGILLANQKSMRVALMISALNKILSETTVEDWDGQVRWINNWMK
jgi:hypothetical protein